ncbi:MAG TPA: bifunctional glutamate N-acetyltransferase/amino-acid acetyltransferase ArgJ [Vicinamibacterales bacterium]|nr:bifunctional glutamate N-acetyltransferase/amino-acid acetyltransferase ArgJ [Vicinamibacterales bacterium]
MRTIGRPIISPIDGGITAPDGIRGSGLACGIKTSGRPDLAVIATSRPVSAAGIFTTNQAKAAPVIVSQEHLAWSEGVAQIIVTNSGCANACTGPQGMADAREMAVMAANRIGCAPSHALVASTGVIGVNLNMEALRGGIPRAIDALSRDGQDDAARAIMTTDPFPKSYAVEVSTTAGRFRVGGMAKGSGMIEPRMATMLGFLTTDAAVAPAMLRRALEEASRYTFNAITVDGEASTNDCVFAVASGESAVRIDEEHYAALFEGFRAVALELSLGIVRGGEGATKLVAITVSGARSQDEAWIAARVIANSPLVKTAIHGGDPNWGRLVAAAGRAGVTFALEQAMVRIGSLVLFSDGEPHDHLAPKAAEYLQGTTLEIEVNVGAGGSGRATIYTCDLSAEYVRINAEYRT